MFLGPRLQSVVGHQRIRYGNPPYLQESFSDLGIPKAFLKVSVFHAFQGENVPYMEHMGLTWIYFCRRFFGIPWDENHHQTPPFGEFSSIVAMQIQVDTRPFLGTSDR